MDKKEIHVKLARLNKYLEERSDVGPGHHLFELVIFAEGIRKGLESCIQSLDRKT